MSWVPPTEQKCESQYPTELGPDTYELFRLGTGGIPASRYSEAQGKLSAFEHTQQGNFLGYQINMALEFAHLQQYLNMSLNNIGDPFTAGNLTVNTKMCERAVLDYFASLWRAQWPHLKGASQEMARESYWGYVVSMGGSEGNLYGLWNARDYLSGKVLFDEPVVTAPIKKGAHTKCRHHLPKAIRGKIRCKSGRQLPSMKVPVAFFSQDSHYSIVKMMVVLDVATYFDVAMEHHLTCPLHYPADYPPNYPAPEGNPFFERGWPKMVPSNDDGSVYIPALVKLVGAIAALGHPIMINFNYGSTFKGAYDDVQAAVTALLPIYAANHLMERTVHYDPTDDSKYDTRTGFWHHVDGALGASHMPFLEMAAQQGKFKFPEGYRFPVFDFRIKELHSIACSGHKWTGAPTPCGIIITKGKYQLMPPENPEYIGSPDTTFAGSRNGLAPLALWDYLARHGYEAQMDKALRLDAITEYVKESLLRLEKELGKDLRVHRSPLSLTVRFLAAPKDIVQKYSLSGETLIEGGERIAYNHIFSMEHVTRERVDQFIEDLRKSDYPAPTAHLPYPHRAL